MRGTDCLPTGQAQGEGIACDKEEGGCTEHWPEGGARGRVSAFLTVSALFHPWPHASASLRPFVL